MEWGSPDGTRGAVLCPHADWLALLGAAQTWCPAWDTCDAGGAGLQMCGKEAGGGPIGLQAGACSLTGGLGPLLPSDSSHATLSYFLMVWYMLGLWVWGRGEQGSHQCPCASPSHGTQDTLLGLWAAWTLCQAEVPTAPPRWVPQSHLQGQPPGSRAAPRVESLEGPWGVIWGHRFSGQHVLTYVASHLCVEEEDISYIGFRVHPNPV